MEEKKMEIKKCITTILLGIALCSPAKAQDFYKACRGPRSVQIDTYLNSSNNKTTRKIIPKLFTKNLDKTLPDFVLALPCSVSEKGKAENKGINLGYITKNKYGNFIGALGLFKDNKKKYNILNPQLYFTHIRGPWTFDFESDFPINLKTNTTGGSNSLTLGYRINDRLRIGGSIIKNKDKELKYRANARIELTKDHQYWLQTYIGENSLGIRLAMNF